jgi:hypothetical protein
MTVPRMARQTRARMNCIVGDYKNEQTAETGHHRDPHTFNFADRESGNARCPGSRKGINKTATQRYRLRCALERNAVLQGGGQYIYVLVLQYFVDTSFCKTK